MPRNKEKDPIPYLDPAYNPSHPYNQTPPPRPLDVFEQIAGHSLSKLADRKWDNDWYDQQMEVWTPPHVIRSWESDPERARRRALILAMVLHPKDRPVNEAEQATDFRMFGKRNLRTAYERIHETEEPGIDPDEVCWELEYSETECNITRRSLARLLGEFPAETDQTNHMYDPYKAEMYQHRLYCRCRRKNKKCIRPSHISIFTAQLKDLP